MSPEEKDSIPLEVFREAGRRGGKLSRAKLTPEQRRRSARKAAKARWAKHRNPEIARIMQEKGVTRQRAWQIVNKKTS